jgi:hypothetical protein
VAIPTILITGNLAQWSGQAAKNCYGCVFRPNVATGLTDIKEAQYYLGGPRQTVANSQGIFSMPLFPTDYKNIAPPGWFWICAIHIGGSWQSFQFFLPSSYSPTVDFRTLMPSGFVWSTE